MQLDGRKIAKFPVFSLLSRESEAGDEFAQDWPLRHLTLQHPALLSSVRRSSRNQPLGRRHQKLLCIVRRAKAIGSAREAALDKIGRRDPRFSKTSFAGPAPRSPAA
jgi:hypothetical protein